MEGGVLEYFGQLPLGVQATLFKDAWTCQAILRALSPLAQLYVLRLASSQSPLPAALVRSWAQLTQEAQQKHDAAISLLVSLGLLSEVGTSTSSSFALHEEFGAQLMRALRGGAAVRGTAAANLAADKNKPTLEQLEAYATQTWELLLESVISPPLKPIALQLTGASLQGLLQQAGLLEQAQDAEALEMGLGARSFLLQPVHVQVWRLMLAYMQLAEASGAGGARDALLSFLMRLGFLEQGVDYSVEELSAAQRSVLPDLVLLGLVYMRKLNSRRYYATPLAVRLLSGAARAAPSDSCGFLVLETNFRLYAYTSSPLWAQILGEFAQLLYQLPNMVVAQLTRESVRHAVDAGVEPQQIVRFLERNAHPLMAAQTPVLPETVIHQMLLWAAERERIQAVPARLYENFASVAVFDRAEQYARDIGAHEWSRRGDIPAKCALAVAADAHERMKMFLRKTASQQQQ